MRVPCSEINESLASGACRNPQTSLTGTTNWTTKETPFLLEKGPNPDLVKLNLVTHGEGTAWIDDIVLLKGPLR